MTSDLSPDPRLLRDASSATDRGSWLELVDRIGDEVGYFQSLGPRHWAFFRDDGPILVVSFETLEAIRAQGPGQLPLGDCVARAEGWSHLCLIADGETWYRDAAVHRYFDRLVDDAFFEDFDRIVFYGAGMGGYAACAFSPTAPAATVIAVTPRATLEPAVAGWDPRHRTLRRLDFTDRYGYAPDMVEGTGEVFLLFDPAEPLDAMHAALFRGPHVHLQRLRNVGSPLEAALLRIGLVGPLIAAGARGTLGPGRVARLWRARRDDIDYVVHHLALNAGRPRRARKVLNTAERTFDAAELRERLLDLHRRLSQGRG
ncbi:phosphoadenosine phosphosulfate reductase [Cereibacter sphaeroides]|uniref:phosphoadenosine phosphosulfate reductase n=1 Tax=Cereibacter sphaeroides TaxID=1063 RepID=UPI001F458FEE|nr:phosphoadenosine phosphosulfate reductase [Cereibacter sphaeroides]MCE6959039.1 phosphoadenosine phosphosulfate reductase [Cereibacter sphaeroides]MCE6969103.1 phosphoadenosine phosphosulfate reductase [Cereibacter sphaeroides]MCE6973619.1 phosphoadenosine phosphosulfate reductase [Cereibacter sphaeroides]